jgi:hypothetical protein
MNRKRLYILSTVVFAVIVLFITLPPVTLLLDRVRPRILGFPFMQFWLLAIPLLLSVWLIIWFVLECRIEDRDAILSGKSEGGERNE